MTTPHEAVAVALAAAYGNANHSHTYAYQRDATAAIEALRKNAAAAVQRAYNEDMGDTIAIETAEILVSAVLGPPERKGK